VAVKPNGLTHKIAIQLHLVAKRSSFAVLTPGGQSGNFWVHCRIFAATLHIRDLRTRHAVLTRDTSKMVNTYDDLKTRHINHARFNVKLNLLSLNV
jgi:hypothetical protein